MYTEGSLSVTFTQADHTFEQISSISSRQGETSSTTVRSPRCVNWQLTAKNTRNNSPNDRVKTRGSIAAYTVLLL